MALVDVIMPQLGESIAEGTISKWYKKQGDAIGKDETLLEISTDKVDSEIPSPVAGRIAELLFPEQTTVSVMTVIARLETDVSITLNSGSVAAPPAAAGAAAPASANAAEQADIPQASVTAQVQDAFSSGTGTAVAEGTKQASAPESGHDGRSAGEPHHGRFYSPLVLNIAKREQIPLEELERIEGTGTSGRVSKNDLLAWIERRKRAGTQAPAQTDRGTQAHPDVQRAQTAVASGGALDIRVIEPMRTPRPSIDAEREERIPMDTMRRSIADRMVSSKQTSPHVYSVTEADVSTLVAYRDRMKADFERREGVKLTLTPFFLDAVVKALREFPYINASVDNGVILLKKDIHLGVAVALENGLIVPVIRHADEKNIAGLARAVSDLASRARTKKLMPDDVQGGTFTVTNPGMIGNLYGIPIINQPQVAILAIGAVKKRPIAIDDAIAIRSMVYLSLSYDHRIIDGLMGGQFLERIVSLLEQFNTQVTV
ncbi:MAG TPA: dihydrolipoamide acetyltransferase family protein [Bacteroidota bacterium]|nr:dihydrolipoamide acetyltransferase family protein [Bacteroidota bacterium]